MSTRASSISQKRLCGAPGYSSGVGMARAETGSALPVALAGSPSPRIPVHRTAVVIANHEGALSALEPPVVVQPEGVPRPGAFIGWSVVAKCRRGHTETLARAPHGAAVEVPHERAIGRRRIREADALGIHDLGQPLEPCSGPYATSHRPPIVPLRTRRSPRRELSSDRARIPLERIDGRARDRVIDAHRRCRVLALVLAHLPLPGEQPEGIMKARGEAVLQIPIPRARLEALAFVDAEGHGSYRVYWVPVSKRIRSGPAACSHRPGATGWATSSRRAARTRTSWRVSFRICRRSSVLICRSERGGTAAGSPAAHGQRGR